MIHSIISNLRIIMENRINAIEIDKPKEKRNKDISHMNAACRLNNLYCEICNTNLEEIVIEQEPYMICHNPACKNYGILFTMPKIKLKVIGKMTPEEIIKYLEPKDYTDELMARARAIEEEREDSMPRPVYNNDIPF